MIHDRLNDMMEHRRLADIEQEMTDAFARLDSRGNDVKLCLMLAMAAEQAIARLDRIDTAAFPEQIRERAQKLIDQHQARLKELISHQQENARITESIARAEAELRPLLDRIGDELSRTDRILRDYVAANDSSQVSAL